MIDIVAGAGDSTTCRYTGPRSSENLHFEVILMSPPFYSTTVFRSKIE